MPNIDPAVINTVLLTLFGVGGSVLVFRYIGPILSTQEKNRVEQEKEIGKLRTEMDAATRERVLLREMVTQRAQVDDFRQSFKIAVDDNSSRTRLAVDVAERHARDTADQHQAQILVMREMVATLRDIHARLGGEERRYSDKPSAETQRLEQREDTANHRSEVREDVRDARADKREDRRDDREDRRDAREDPSEPAKKPRAKRTAKAA